MRLFFVVCPPGRGEAVGACGVQRGIGERARQEDWEEPGTRDLTWLAWLGGAPPSIPTFHGDGARSASPAAPSPNRLAAVLKAMAAC
jgi:hypothetical protein